MSERNQKSQCSNRAAPFYAETSRKAAMRRKSTAPAKVWRRLEAQLNLYSCHVRRLLDEVDVRADLRIRRKPG